MPELVSVIVMTKNNAPILARTLEAVKRQTYPNIETIVVDNFSKDRTAEIAKKYTEKVYLFGPERSAQINHGVDQTQGKYILRLASDLVLQSTVIEEGVKLLEEGYDSVGIAWLPDRSMGFWSRVRYAEMSCFLSLDPEEQGPAMMRKKDWIPVDESLSAGEDFDFSDRFLKEHPKIALTRGVMIHTGEPKHLAEIVRKNIYYGKCLRGSDSRLKRRLLPLRERYWRHRKNFRGSLLPGFLLYELVKYESAFLGLCSQWSSPRTTRSAISQRQ